MDFLNTNDAMATAEDIAWGKEAYARGERIVGTMNLPPIEELNGNMVYANFEGDGIADGIIFADLKVGKRGDGLWGRFLGRLYNTDRRRIKRTLCSKWKFYKTKVWKLNRRINSRY